MKWIERMVGQNLGSKSVHEFLKWFHASFGFLCVFLFQASRSSRIECTHFNWSAAPLTLSGSLGKVLYQKFPSKWAEDFGNELTFRYCIFNCQNCLKSQPFFSAIEGRLEKCYVGCGAKKTKHRPKQEIFCQKSHRIHKLYYIFSHIWLIFNDKCR